MSHIRNEEKKKNTLVHIKYIVYRLAMNSENMAPLRYNILSQPKHGRGGSGV